MRMLSIVKTRQTAAKLPYNETLDPISYMYCTPPLQAYALFVARNGQ